MKLYNNKEVTSRFFGLKPILMTYRGLQLVWSAVMSCFSAGWWDGNKPWNGNNAWKG